MCDSVKDLLYKPIKQDSRNVAKLGNMLGWDWLEQEGKKNTGNPGRAAGKALASAATWYLGGPLLSGAGAAGGATIDIAAQEALKTAAQKALEQSATQGLMQAPQGFANTMEAGLMGSGDTLTNAAMMSSMAPPPGVAAPGMMQGLLGQMDTALINNGMPQLAGRVGQPLSKGRQFAVGQGLKMMQPQEMPPAPPAPRYQHQEQQQAPMYGSQTQGMDEEMKRKLRAMGYTV